MPKTIQLSRPAKPPKPSFAQKKENKKRQAELEQYGLSLGDITSSRQQNRFFLCFIRAVLIFMACFGMLGAVVSSFGLKYSIPIVVLGLFCLSLLSAFLYYNKVSFYVGYFIVFAGFIFFSFRFYWHINSGYQAFSNEVFNKYSDYFHLLSTREATEFIENRYLTVTAAMLFMGWFFSILLNITISGYMDLPMTFLLTFLPLQIPFYIDIVPPIPYLVLLIAVYISVAILGRSGHFALPYRHTKSQFFDRKRSRHATKHTYLASSHGMLTITICSVIFSSIFLVLTGAVFSGDFNGKYVSNRVKDTTDRFVKAAVQNGIYSLFDRYNAKGGLARGQLGGIGNVSPDFETDLIVRMVPYSSESIYLKAYTGVTYDRNIFQPYAIDSTTDNGAIRQLTQDDLRDADAEGYTPQLSIDTDMTLSALDDNNNYYSKVWICNVDGDQGYDYCPYYSFYSTSAHKTISPLLADKAEILHKEAMGMVDSSDTIMSYAPGNTPEKNVYEILYLPYSSSMSYAPNPTVTREYEAFVYQTYLQVPDTLKPVLETFCTEAGLDNLKSLYPKYHRDANGAYADREFAIPQTEAELEQYRANQQYRLGVAASLKRYFATNFDYTMTPGTTPRDRDVVDYFLNNQKRGYCAHFASSATMILRSMGIPTRYCEGYMIPLTAIMDGTPISTDTENWIAGTDKLSESGIVEVDVPDASAHAWIEIYLDGYGWIPYEMTPPSSEETAVSLDLYGLFSGLMTQTRRSASNSSDSADSGTTLEVADQIGNSIFAVLGGLKFLYRPLLILLGVLILFLISLPIAQKIMDAFRVHILCKKELYGDALLYSYRKLLQGFRRRKQFVAKNPTLREFDGWLESHRERFKDLSSDEIRILHESLQRAAFAKQHFDHTHYQCAAAILSKLGKGMKKEKK